MTLLMAAGLLFTVGASAYVFCLRPMRRGSRPHTRGDLAADLASARREVAQLRGRAQLPAPAAARRAFPVTGGSSPVSAAPAGPATLERSERPPPPGGDAARWRRHFPVNMSQAERVARVAAGLSIAALAGLVVPGAFAGAWGVSLIALGWLAVADLVVSGLTGHCPVHRFVRLPWDPGRQA